MPPIPKFFTDFVDWILSPTTFCIAAVVAFALMILLRRVWTRGSVVAVLGLAGLVLYAWSFTDKDFVAIVAQPDNVPISLLFFSLGIVLWLAFRKMVINDRLTEKGLPTFEARESEQRVLCWPDLLYSEFLALILCSIFLLVWAVVLKAPLEEPAHPSKTTNPSKAPWYFVGLQEMLVYFDPSLAGVVFPSFIIVGLMAIPFLDPNPKGNGYYTFKERPFAITTFLFGFIFWILLIVFGTFLRGPNWNCFSPYAHWDPYKVEALNNVNLSEIIYNRIFAAPLPSNILLREGAGILVILLYYGCMPLLLATFVFRKIYPRMGFIRFNIMVFFLLTMAALPIKMVLRWVLNLKYVVAIPEWFFNI